MNDSLHKPVDGIKWLGILLVAAAEDESVFSSRNWRRQAC